jgi:hypothetical protein
MTTQPDTELRARAGAQVRVAGQAGRVDRVIRRSPCL